MRPLSIVALLVGYWLIPVNAIAQDSFTQKRTQELVASFNKEKHVVKEKTVSEKKSTRRLSANL